VREMTSPEGGFYSTQDADSEGEEAKFFIWTADEIRSVLGGQADRFIETYGNTERGNFEGKNILELRGSLEERESLAQILAALSLFFAHFQLNREQSHLTDGHAPAV
jgi:uncharacterized protein YyaL (SSP411 family)